MPNLIVLFSFERANSQWFTEENRYGEGSCKVWTEREPETQEDFTEIAKAIFDREKYSQVGITKVFYDDNDLFVNLKNPEKPIDFKIDANNSAGIEELIQDSLNDQQ